MKVLDAHYSFRCLIHTISYTIGYLVQGQAGGRDVPKPATNFKSREALPGAKSSG